MANQEYKRDMTTPPDDDAVSGLLAGLGRVEAPNDFEFRVRAGIAKQKAAGRRGSWVPVTAGVAVPLSLAVLVGGYFGFGSLYPTGNGSEGVQTQAQMALPVIPAPAQPALTVPAAPAGSEVEQQPVSPIATASLRKRVAPIAKTTRTASGGSFVEASSEGRTIRPRGFNPEQKTVVDPNTINNGAELKAESVFSGMGVKATYTAGGWKVDSVTTNNMAEKAGVRSGDVIEAINGQAVTDKTTFGNKFTGRSLRVKRDGKSVDINLNR